MAEHSMPEHMPATHARRPRSLARTMFATVLIFTLIAVFVTSVVMVSVAYHAEEKRSEEQLVEQARTCATMLDGRSTDERIDLLQDQFVKSERFTLIDPEGVVVYDTHIPNPELDNHVARPEMQVAEHDGEGVLVRYSDTLQRDTLYVAERLADGSYIRISQERLSLVAFLSSMALPVGVALVCAVLLVVLLSRFLTVRIMKPLDTLDVHAPLEGDVYLEMRPLLTRIDEQQHQLRRQNEELKEAEGFRREFSANVSHEMKTPLQVISGSAEMIASGMVNANDVQDFGGRIYAESQHLRALINDVLTLSRLDESSFDSAERTPIDLLEVVRRTCERLQPLAEKHGVAVACAGEDITVCGNESLLEHAVSNLIENAIRYTHPQGHVRVQVSSCPTPAGAEAQVQVADNGIGIAPKDQEKIFERFYRSDKSRSKETGGTGLGLAIVKHAALYHGGDVSVESTPGVGSTFTLHLPLS